MSDTNERKLIARIADQDLLIRRLIDAGNNIALPIQDGCAHDEDGCDQCHAAVAIWDRLVREVQKTNKAP
jgi:hypothetical protein